MSKLVARTVPGKLVFVGEILGGGKDFKPKMDELVIDIVLDIIIVIMITDDFLHIIIIIRTRCAFCLAPLRLGPTLVFPR